MNNDETIFLENSSYSRYFSCNVIKDFRIKIDVLEDTT